MSGMLYFLYLIITKSSFKKTCILIKIILILCIISLLGLGHYILIAQLLVPEMKQDQSNVPIDLIWEATITVGSMPHGWR